MADADGADDKVAAGSRVGVPEVEVVTQVMGNRIQGRAPEGRGRVQPGCSAALRSAAFP